MLIFEFNNGSLINLITMESVMTDGSKYWMICQSGTRYELDKDEFETIKNIFREKLQNN